jgi:hypothetical protein
MNTKQIKECEEICKNIVNKKMSVFASNSSLAAAKDIQGLRAIFDEVSGCYNCCYLKNSGYIVIDSELSSLWCISSI